MRLIDADALIIAFCENPSYSASMFSKIKARINAAPTIEAKPQWIPVTDKLPEDGEMVAAIVNGNPRKNIKLIGAYQMATYYHGEGWVVELFPEWTEADVTHWMPLPEPPEDGGGT